jgi:homoserine dehydrogenase
MQRHEGGYYIPAGRARQAGYRGNHCHKACLSRKFPLESIVQRHDLAHLGRGTKAGSVPVILITYATSEDAVRKALRRWGAIG